MAPNPQVVRTWPWRAIAFMSELSWSGRVTKSRRVEGPTGEAYLAKGLRSELRSPAVDAAFFEVAQRNEGWNQPGVAAVHLVQQTPPRMLCEYIPGYSLATLVQRAWAQGEGVPVDVAVAVAQAILRVAVRVERDQGLHHGALCCKEVMVTFEGQIALTDFGLVSAVALAGANIEAPELAPEIVHGEPPAEVSDVFGVAVVIYEALVSPSCQVFAGKQMPASWREATAGLAELIEDALAVVAASRPQSLEEMQARLQDAARTASLSPTADSIRAFAQRYWLEDPLGDDDDDDEPPDEATRVAPREMIEHEASFEEEQGATVGEVELIAADQARALSHSTHQERSADEVSPSELSDDDLEMPTRQELSGGVRLASVDMPTAPADDALPPELLRMDTSTDAAAAVFEDEEPTGGDGTMGTPEDELEPVALPPIDELPPPSSGDVWAVDPSTSAPEIKPPATPVLTPGLRPAEVPRMNSLPPPPPAATQPGDVHPNEELSAPEWEEATGARREDSRSWMRQPLIGDSEAGPTNRAPVPLASPPVLEPIPSPVPKAPQRAVPTAHIRKRVGDHDVIPTVLPPEGTAQMLATGPSNNAMNLVSWILAALVVVLSGLVLALLLERSSLIEELQKQRGQTVQVAP